MRAGRADGARLPARRKATGWGFGMAQEIRSLQAPSRWATYLPWNNAVADVIFSREAAGAPAYLDLEEDVLRRVAEAAGYQGGAPREALAAAVRGTLNPVGFPSGVFGTQLFRLNLWKPGSPVPPP